MSTIAPEMVDRLRQIVGKGEVQYFPNWLHASMDDAVREQGQKVWFDHAQQTVSILYAGNIGKKQGLTEFCRVLSSSTEEFSVRVHGDGGESDELHRWMDSAGDARFSLGPFLGEVDFVRALHGCDFFVITETPSVGASFIPSKLIPCIATGTPVIAVCDAHGPLGREVALYGLGLVVRWADVPSLVPQVRRILSDAAAYREMSRRCIDRSLIYRRDHAIARAEELVALVKAR